MRVFRKSWLLITLAIGVLSAELLARGGTPQLADAGADTVAIAALARELSSDRMRGRGPYTAENQAAARLLAAELTKIGARPIIGNSLLVPFVTPGRERDTVHNVIGVIPSRSGSTSGDLIGITSHFDHLGVRAPDARGDSIHNGFLDAAVPTAMVVDVARRFAALPGDRGLLVMLFNLEEQGLLGARAIVTRADARPVVERMKLLVGVDAGSPAGEAIEWQLMGGAPEHAGTRVADSLARARGWTTTATPPRRISDVFVFSEMGVPILFPIPGKVWRGYTDAQRTEAMTRFDHYHQPADEFRADFPWVGTAHYANWIWDIVRTAASGATMASPMAVAYTLAPATSRAAVTTDRAAQQTYPASQRASLTQNVAFTEITVTYGRPVARGRTLFGSLVQWDRLWHPGADSATIVRVNKDILIDEKPLPAGEYSLWLHPRETGTWTVVFNRNAHVYHNRYPGEGSDALRIEVTPEKGAHMETMAIYFPVVERENALMRIHWGETIVPLKITAAAR